MRLAVVLVLAATTTAHAGRDVVVLVDDPPGVSAVEVAPRALYLNRCVGGCTIRTGSNSAVEDRSSIIPQTSTLSEFLYDDATWDALVACIRATWAPYDLDVVTEEPDPSTPYNEIMIAGFPEEVGQPANTLGLAPMSTSCTPNSDWIAFAFANAHSDPIVQLCDTAAHEPGHILGLDHEYDCKDKMTYLEGCSEKWFLDIEAPCGEFAQDGPRACRCTGETQNSHRILTEILGAGELPPPPEVAILYPMDAAAVQPAFSIIADVVEPRILDRVEFWLNDWPWEVFSGEREVERYTFATPASLPDGVIDVEIRAYNDLQLEGAVAITVQKGEPCASASSCLEGQFCEDGRCAWPPPTGELGDTCAIDADCISRRCATDGEANLCTSYCRLGADDACPAGFTCLDAGDDGLCWPSDRVGGGCCSAGGGGASSAALALLIVVFTGGTGRRRSARRSRS